MAETRDYLKRVAEGGGPSVVAELNRLTFPPMQSPDGQTMRCIDFAAKVIEARSIRRRRESEAAKVKRRREAESRQQHLTSILRRADSVWSGLAPLMDQKAASAYDQAATQLQELRDAYVQAGDVAGFSQKISEFRNRYSNRPAMLRRIETL